MNEWMSTPCTCSPQLTYGDHNVGCPRAMAFRREMAEHEKQPAPVDLETRIEHLVGVLKEIEAIKAWHMLPRGLQDRIRSAIRTRGATIGR